MKRKLTKSLMMLMVILFVLAGCSTPTPEPVTTQEPAVAETASVIETTEVEVTAIPTEIPEPFPCAIAFDSDRDNNREIYTMSADGSKLINLTNNPADDFDPVWSPDGSQIAFVSNRETDQESGQYIFVMNTDGSNVRQLTYENWSDWPDWSKDGSQITYTGNDDIYIINADGSGQPIILTNSPEKDQQSSWSPDGAQIAWISGDDQTRNIFVMNADGSNQKQITDSGNQNSVVWTVDGRLFAGWGWKDQEQSCNNCVFDADGSNRMDAGGKGDLRRYFPFWTDDDLRVECVSANFNNESVNEIYLLGTALPDFFLNLTNNPANDLNPDWPANCGYPPVVIGYAGDDPSQQQRRNDFQKACDELSTLCVYGGMSDLIDKNVSAIVLNSTNGSEKDQQQDIQKALDKGIPVFLLDAELEINGLYSVTIDQQQWAKISLEWMFEKMGGEGQFAYFDLNPALGHLDVINEMLSKYPEVSVIDHRDSQDDPWASKPITADLLKSNPEIKAIWTNGFYDGILQGVVDESGAPMDKWPLMVCDASSSGLSYWNDIMNTNPNFDCIAVGNPAGIAYDAVYAANFLINGSQIDETARQGKYGNSLMVDFPVVTKENFQEWFDKNDNVNQYMSPEEIQERWFLK